MLTCLDDLSAGPAAVREPREPITVDDRLAGPDNEQEERQEAAKKGHVVIIGALPLILLLLACFDCRCHPGAGSLCVLL